MSKTPFYRVSIASSGRDITSLISSFTFEDCTKEDDLLKLSLRNKSIALIDDDEFVEGAILNFMFGYLGGRTSSRRQAKITDIEYSYGETIDITISASDLGRELKMTESSKIWKNVNASQIVQQIAAKYGMTWEVTGVSPKIYQSLPQGNRTDFEFLQYLTTIEPGNRIFYVKDAKIFFVNRDMDRPPARTYTYGNGNGPVLRFRPKIKKDKKNASGGETSVNDIDPTSKDQINAKSSDNQKKTGKYIYNANADLLEKRNTEEQSTTTGKNLAGVPAQNAEDARNAADKAKQDGELNGITADLDLEGDPDLRSDEIITMAGVAKRHLGNWYVEKVTHRIDNGGYKTTCNLNKNGTAKPVGSGSSEADPANVNNKRTYVYDENSNLKTIKTVSPD